MNSGLLVMAVSQIDGARLMEDAPSVWNAEPPNPHNKLDAELEQEMNWKKERNNIFEKKQLKILSFDMFDKTPN